MHSVRPAAPLTLLYPAHLSSSTPLCEGVRVRRLQARALGPQRCPAARNAWSRPPPAQAALDARAAAPLRYCTTYVSPRPAWAAWHSG